MIVLFIQYGKALDKRGYLMILEGYFFLFFIETLCCDSSSEPSRRDGSDEGSQLCFYAELTKGIPYYHQILTLNWTDYGI